MHSFSSFILSPPAAQFDSCERPPRDDGLLHAALSHQPQPQPQSHQHLRQKSWTQKILRSSLPSLSPATGSCELEAACCVDPSLPLEKQR